MIVTVQPYNLYQYNEVYEILQWKDGCVFKTRSTGQYVKSDWVNPDPKKWKTASVSTSLMKGGAVNLPLFGGDL